MNQPVQAVGMVWYAAEDYTEIKAMMKDGDRLPPSHASWQSKAEGNESNLRGQGYLIFRANLKPDAFRKYCLLHGLDLDSRGRTHFANFIAAEEYRKLQGMGNSDPG
jgi:hypothetical protein